MKIHELKAEYKKGTIPKQKYIEMMHQVHEILFEYSEFIRDTDIASIEISDGKVTMTSRAYGIKILCDEIDHRTAPIEVLNINEYEKSELAIIKRLIGPNFRIFDIGANIGWYSLVLSKIFKDSNIYSFEPIPKTFLQLKQNIELNDADNIHAFNFGFSDQTGPLTFYYYPEGSGNSSAAKLTDIPSIQKMTCKVKKLDDFVKQKQLGIDFIKCDVEGAELFVFQGGLHAICQNKPIIFTELLRKWSAKFNYHPNKIIDLLTNEGYLCFSIKKEHLLKIHEITEETVETNFFFLHETSHARQIKKLVKP